MHTLELNTILEKLGAELAFCLLAENCPKFSAVCQMKIETYCHHDLLAHTAASNTYDTIYKNSERSLCNDVRLSIYFFPKSLRR